MAPSRKPSKANLEKKILEHIGRSGYPFEWEVRKKVLLASQRYSSNIDLSEMTFKEYFKDPEEGKFREIDVQWRISTDKKTFSSPNKTLWATFEYYFECKKSENRAWIFFTEPRTRLSPIVESLNMQFFEIFPRNFLYALEAQKIPLQYINSKHIGYSFAAFPEDGETQIRKSIFQALKAGYVDQSTFVDNLQEGAADGGGQHIDSLHLFFPVVVFSGRMFEYRFLPDGEGNLVESQYVLLNIETSFSDKWFTNTFLVEVVHENYLDEYLNNQIANLRGLIKYINQKKPKITPYHVNLLKK